MSSFRPSLHAALRPLTGLALRIVLIGSVATTPLLANAQTPGSDCAGAREFAQSFYDWYVSTLNREDGAGWKSARRERAASFTEQLTHALDEDAAAQAKVRGYTVGLDFDPFVNSQDPEDHYEAGAVLKQRERCWVDVRGVRRGSLLRDRPDAR